ncbi:MAG: protein-export chaperone SecB [Gemmatimonadales bacterium]|nr:protein-export chaperone SecB [Gemmatimonadales bacterium]
MTAPVFQIQRIYLKDCSLEQPHAPRILLEQAQPQVEIALDLQVESILDGIWEVRVTATVTAKIAARTLFLVEAEQAGIFELRNLPPEQVDAILHVNCATMVYPYLRASVSDLCTRAGVPPVMLAEVNFHAMYEQKLAGEGGAASGPLH